MKKMLFIVSLITICNCFDYFGKWCLVLPQPKPPIEEVTPIPHKPTPIPK